MCPGICTKHNGAGHCWWTRGPRGHKKPSSTVDFGWYVASYFNKNYPCYSKIQSGLITWSLPAPDCFGTVGALHVICVNYIVWQRYTERF